MGGFGAPGHFVGTETDVLDIRLQAETRNFVVALL